ncbi:glycosyltransferase family 39 protein [candidate division FCPU426 bacterium]|nr:glycosyltransferase family 39 protein [candidate division FCPU426 bacterium]
MSTRAQILTIWILLGSAVLIRLFGITKPLVDRQYWRQADTAAIARNFYTEDMNIFYPRVDWRGDTAGYVESEFPLYPYLVAGWYHVFGPKEIIGRMVSLGFAVGTVWIIFIFVRRLFDFETAVYSAFMYALSPMVVHYTRAFMPESMMMFFYLAGLYAFFRWVGEKNAWWWGAIAWAATSLAVLAKLTAVTMLAPMAGILWDKSGWDFYKSRRMILFFLTVLIPPVLWYAHAYNLFLETGLSFGVISGAGYNKFTVPKLLLYPPFWMLLAERFFVLQLTPLGGALSLLGFFAGFFKREVVAGRTFLYVWAFSQLLFTLVVAEGIRVLEYYQIFIVPIAGIFMARGILTLKTGFPEKIVARFTFVLLVLICLVFYREHFLYFVYPYSRSSHAFAQKVRDLTPRQARFLVIDTDGKENPRWYKRMKHRISCPSLLYYLDRKGWVVLPYELEEMTPLDLDELMMKGAGYFAAPKGAITDKEKIMELLRLRGWPLIFEDQDFVLYEMRRQEYTPFMGPPGAVRPGGRGR